VTTLVQALAIVLAGAGGAMVALTRNPLRQTMLTGVYGLVLVVLFLAYQAPDVALSALVVGSVALPLMALLALAKVSGGRR
jgi:uncharacterized MnhB-related membrane protein